MSLSETCCILIVHQWLTSLLCLQGLLKKHEAFETDFTVHKDRVNDVCTNGQDLIKKVSLDPRKTLVLSPEYNKLRS